MDLKHKLGLENEALRSEFSILSLSPFENLLVLACTNRLQCYGGSLKYILSFWIKMCSEERDKLFLASLDAAVLSVQAIPVHSNIKETLFYREIVIKQKFLLFRQRQKNNILFKKAWSWEHNRIRWLIQQFLWRNCFCWGLHERLAQSPPKCFLVGEECWPFHQEMAFEAIAQYH